MAPQMIAEQVTCCDAGLAGYMRQGMNLGRVSENTAILEVAAALAENSAIQQEIALNSHRQFHLEVRLHGLATLGIGIHWRDLGGVVPQNACVPFSL